MASLAVLDLAAVPAAAHVRRPQGYDFLAIRALVARGAITGVGRKVGVGKESDVYEVRTTALARVQCSASLLPVSPPLWADGLRGR